MMDSFINEEDLEFNEIVDELDMPMLFDPTDKQLKLLFDNKKKSKVQIVTDSESEEEEIEKIEEEDDGEGFYDDFDIGLYDSDDEDEELEVEESKDEELIDNATIDETKELDDLENLDDDLKFHQEMLDIEREKNYKEILTIEIDDIIQGDSRQLLIQKNYI